MERKANAERSRGLLAALILVVPALLAGCATPAPNQLTKLDWPGFDTRLVVPTPAPRREYAARREAPRPVHRIAVAHIERPAPRPQIAAAADPAPAPVAPVAVSYDPSDGSNFVWPVSGRVISAFGKRDNGEVNDGINIATKLGAPIRAAAAGTVTYTGNELSGYGNLVLIEHDNGYVTAYAHAESITVGKGERVQKGEVIGYAGDTGDVHRPQLHFEIRHDLKPVNPETLLASSS